MITVCASMLRLGFTIVNSKPEPGISILPYLDCRISAGPRIGCMKNMNPAHRKIERVLRPTFVPWTRNMQLAENNRAAASGEIASIDVRVRRSAVRAVEA